MSGQHEHDEAGGALDVLQVLVLGPRGAGALLAPAVRGGGGGKVPAEDLQRVLGEVGQLVGDLLGVVAAELLGGVVDGVLAVLVEDVEEVGHGRDGGRGA